jgi:flagellar basal-body rod protein FlgG
VVGDGFFQVQGGEQILYTRVGALSLNAVGAMVFASVEAGRLLEPAIAVPKDATEIEISREGVVSVRQPADQSLTQIGQIQLARFINPAGLEPRGENLFAATEASGAPALGNPASGGAGELRQGFLEGSNVNLVDELLQLKQLEQQMHALLQAASVWPEWQEPAEFLVPTDRRQPSVIADPLTPAERR